MKTILVALIALALGTAARGQNVDAKDVVGPNNTFFDAAYGVALTYPAGWEVLGGGRWGENNGDNTFRFRPLWPSEAMPSLYYKRYVPEGPQPPNLEPHFRDAAARKAASRVPMASDYRNLEETFSFRTIAGRPGFSYLATFTRYGRPMMEYFVRVAGEKVYVMFFTVGSPEDINAIRADIDRMAESIRIP